LAAIIGLPMIFDSEPKPLSDDIDIQIPSRDKAAPAASRPMTLPPEPVAADPKADAAGDPMPAKSASVAKVEPAAKSEAESKTVSDAKLASPAPAADAKKAVPSKMTPPKADTTPHSEAAAATDRLAEAIAEKTRGRFVVQVAAVSSQAKAEELQNRLKKAGIQAYSQRVSTKDGDRFRIRIGPFGSREEADKMRGRLGPLGLSGTVQPV